MAAGFKGCVQTENEDFGDSVGEGPYMVLRICEKNILKCKKLLTYLLIKVYDEYSSDDSSVTVGPKHV